MAEKIQGNKQTVEQVADKDAFWLTDLYPDAKALFQHEQPKLSDISDKCIVVLDANVLLIPFEMQSASVAEIEKVYEALAGEKRLVVPGQAAREFYKNRSGKIAAIADVIDGGIDRAKRQIFDQPIPLLEDDEDYIAARKLAGEIAKNGQEIAKKLAAVNERLKDEIGGDRVSGLYRKVLGDCVCEIELDATQRAEMVTEVARRARLEIAPGFKDQSKEDGGVGDYLIWKTALQEAASRAVHCIFVTEEKKPDWWIKRKGAFQPRPELLDEFRAATNGKSVHLIPLSGLLSTFKANEAVVQQVQELEERNRLVSEVRRKKVANVVNARTVFDKALEATRRDLTTKKLQLAGIQRKIRDYSDRDDNNQSDTELAELEHANAALRAEIRKIEKSLQDVNARFGLSDNTRDYLRDHYLISVGGDVIDGDFTD